MGEKSYTPNKLLRKIEEFGDHIDVEKSRYPYDALFDIDGRSVAVEVKLGPIKNKDIRIFQQMLAVAPADILVVIAGEFDTEIENNALQNRILLIYPKPLCFLTPPPSGAIH